MQIRFDFSDQVRPHDRMWLVIDRDDSEVCIEFPGGADDLVVETESVALAEWHTGRSEWAQLLRSGRLVVHGPPRLCRELPTWNLRSPWTGAPPA